MLEEIIQNRYAVTAVILFGIGFTNLMLQQNLLRKVIGFNIMDSANSTTAILSCREFSFALLLNFHRSLSHEITSLFLERHTELC